MNAPSRCLALAAISLLGVAAGCSERSAERTAGSASAAERAAKAGSGTAGSGAAGSGTAGSGTAGSSHAAHGHDEVAVAEVLPAAAKLPGTLWYVEGRSLVRLVAGVRTVFTDPDAALYPSGQALPDGRLIAIASRGDGSGSSEQLVAIGETAERFGFTAAQLRDPAVDATGTAVVVAANRDGHSDLYRIEVATGRDRRLTDHAAGNFRPARLGRGLVFVSSRDGNSELYRRDAMGAKDVRLTAFHRDDWEPVPSPDGREIAFLSDREGQPRLFVMAADGTRQRRLTTRAVSEAQPSDEAAALWSPDGRSLAYLVEEPGRSTLWLRDLATGRERVITPAGVRDAEPAFSPDGAWLVTSRGTGAAFDLWASPVGGGPAVQLTTGGGAERLPRWR